MCAECILEHTQQILCNLNNRGRYNNSPKLAVLGRFLLEFAIFCCCTFKDFSHKTQNELAQIVFRKSQDLNNEHCGKKRRLFTVQSCRYEYSNKCPLSLILLCYKELLLLIQSFPKKSCMLARICPKLVVLVTSHGLSILTRLISVLVKAPTKGDIGDKRRKVRPPCLRPRFAQFKQ